MERATASMERDVQLLIEQMYDALDRHTIDRDKLRDLTDNLSDVIVPLTMIAAVPLFKPEFDKPELNAAGFSIAESGIVGILNLHFGRIVRKEALVARVKDHHVNGDAHARKTVEVQVCNIRAKLKGSRYGIRTEWGVGYALDYAEKCIVVGGGNQNAARKPSPP